MTLSGQTWKCSAGETFDSVALQVYGDENYACELLNANPALSLIPMFTGGEILQLPVVEVVNVVEDPDAVDFMPAKAPWKE